MLIIGAGVIGLSIAWTLAKKGVKVTILEEGAVGRDASWASAGMLAPRIQLDVSEPGVGKSALEVLKLEMASKDLWKEFSTKLEMDSGMPTGYKLGGSLTVAFNKAEEEDLGAQLNFNRKAGLMMEWKSSKEAVELEPKLSRNVTAATYSPDDGLVDPRSVLLALKEAFLRAGGEIRENSPVTSIEVGSGKVKGVVIRGELLPDEQVIVAAGAWSGTFLGLPTKALPPIRPIKGQLMAARLDRRSPLLKHIVFRTSQYYFPRTEERMIIGATFEDVGFDTEITAGGLLELLVQVAETFPEVVHLPVIETWVGLRPRSSDDLPILGPTEIEGLTIATGHFHIGIVLTPITARDISECILANRVPETIRNFGIDRFQGN